MGYDDGTWAFCDIQQLIYMSEGRCRSVCWGRKLPKEVERGGRNSMDARNVDLDTVTCSNWFSNSRSVSWNHSETDPPPPPTPLPTPSPTPRPTPQPTPRPNTSTQHLDRHPIPREPQLHCRQRLQRRYLPERPSLGHLPGSANAVSHISTLQWRTLASKSSWIGWDPPLCQTAIRLS
jgi:hypothetical protein